MSGKVVVITGASSGIGAGLARQFGHRGERLVLAASSGPSILRAVGSKKVHFSDTG